MPRRMTPFWKYHGLGNDFVLLDGRGGGVPALSPDRVVALCDRHLGIGADGILTIVSGGEVAPFRMIVDNADGSRSGMCGNGLRCVARYLWDSGAVTDADSVDIAAGDGVYRCERRSADRAGDRAPDRVLVHMGRAVDDHPDLPPPVTGRDGLLVELDGREHAATRLWLGNPHLVIFVDGDPAEAAARHGARLEHDPRFPERVNVGFARAASREADFELIVHERGVGVTRACGSGACAMAVAAVRRGSWPTGEGMTVRLPGGPLIITVAADGAITMEGEAVPVYRGEATL